MCGIDNILTLKGGKNHKRQKERHNSFYVIVAKDIIVSKFFFCGTSICLHLTRTCQVSTNKILFSTLTNKGSLVHRYKL